MTNAEQIDQIGYAVVPGVLNKEQVATLRKQMAELFDQPAVYPGDIMNSSKGLLKVRGDVFRRYPQFTWLMFHPPIVNAIKSVLGENFTVIPDVGAQDSGYGHWHKDTAVLERHGHHYHWEPDFKMITVGIYLQDNHPLHAGGIDIAAGTHKIKGITEPPAPKSAIGKFIRRVRNSLIYRGIISDRQYSIPNKAGDMIMFDVNINHRGSQPRTKPVPDAFRKFSFFMECAVDNKHARAFTEFIKEHNKDYDWLIDHHYPEEMKQKAKEMGFNLMEA